MTDTLARGIIDGPEARGVVHLVNDGSSQEVRLSDLWVAPGAPDVRLYASADPDGAVDATSIEIGRVPDRQTELAWRLDQPLAPDRAKSIVVYCSVYSVHFGHATLEWTP